MLARVRGFSLAEILVALVVIALLAAVIIPAATAHLAKGEAVRLAQDVTNIRTGIDQFYGDVHRYPGKVSDLTGPITGKTDINGNLYAAVLAARWRGPYMRSDTTSGVMPTALNGSILNTLQKNTNTNAVDYVSVLITGLSLEDFNRIDPRIDGALDASGGLLRFKAGTPDTVKFLAAPIR